MSKNNNVNPPSGAKSLISSYKVMVKGTSTLAEIAAARRPPLNLDLCTPQERDALRKAIVRTMYLHIDANDCVRRLISYASYEKEVSNLLERGLMVREIAHRVRERALRIEISKLSAQLAETVAPRPPRQHNVREVQEELQRFSLGSSSKKTGTSPKPASRQHEKKESSEIPSPVPMPQPQSPIPLTGRIVGTSKDGGTLLVSGVTHPEGPIPRRIQIISKSEDGTVRFVPSTTTQFDLFTASLVEIPKEEKDDSQLPADMQGWWESATSHVTDIFQSASSTVMEAFSRVITLVKDYFQTLAAYLTNKVVKMAFRPERVAQWILDIVIAGFLTWREQWIPLGLHYSGMNMRWGMDQTALVFVGAVAMQLVKQLTEKNAEMQGGTEEEESSGFLSGVASLFYGLVEQYSPKLGFMDFIKSIEPHSKAITFMNGIISLGEKIAKYARLAFGFVYRLITGETYLTESESKDISELLPIVEALSKNYPDRNPNVIAPLHVRAKAIYAKVAHLLDSELALNVKCLLDETGATVNANALSIPYTLINAREEVIRKVDGKCELSTFWPILDQAFEPFKNLTSCVIYHAETKKQVTALHLQKYRKLASKQSRIPTYLILVTGNPGAGKDVLLRILFPYVGSLLGDVEGYAKPYQFTRDLNFQTYEGEKCVQISDLFQMSDEASRLAEIDFIWKLGEVTPQQHDSAHVDVKGTIFNVAELAGATMNGVFPVALPVKVNEAFDRRFSGFYEAILNEAYGITAVDPKGNKVFRLDMAKIDELIRTKNYSELNTVWKLVPIDPRTGKLRPEADGTESYTLIELAVKIAREIKKRRNVASNLDNFVSSVSSVDLMAAAPTRAPKEIAAPDISASPVFPLARLARALNADQPEVYFSASEEDTAIQQMRVIGPVNSEFSPSDLRNITPLLPDYEYDGSPAANKIVAHTLNLPSSSSAAVIQALKNYNPSPEILNIDYELLSATTPYPKSAVSLLDPFTKVDLSKAWLRKEGDYWVFASPKDGTRRADHHLLFLRGELTVVQSLRFFLLESKTVTIALAATVTALIGGLVTAFLVFKDSLGEFQSKSEYNPAGNVQVVRKKAVIPRPTYALLQSLEHDDAYMKSILNNARTIEIESDGKKFINCGTIIRGRLLESVAHAFLDLNGRPHPPDAVVRIYSSGDPYQCYFKDLKIASASKDYAVALLPANCAYGKDISGRLATYNDLERSMPRFNSLHGRRLTVAGPAFVSHRVGDVLDVADVRYKSHNGLDVAPGMLRFSAATERGDCGGLYITGDTSFGGGARKLFAIHSLGIPSIGAAFAVPRTLEDFEALAKFLQDDSPSEAESPAYVTSYPAEQQRSSYSVFNTQGFIPRKMVPHVPTKTEIRPSLIQKLAYTHPGLWPEPKTAPVILYRTKDHDPYAAAMTKIRGSNVLWDDVTRECYKHALEATLADLGTPLLDRPLTWHETFNGLPAYGIPRLPTNTSMGFRGDVFTEFKSRKDLFVSAKDTSPEILEWAQAPSQPSPEDIYPIPALYHEIREKEAMMGKNISPFTIWIDQVKDERKAKEKVKKGRIFSFPPIAQNLIYRKYLACLGVAIGDPTRRIFNGWAYKVNPESPEWEAVRSIFPDLNFIIGDMGNFDACSPPEFNAMDAQLLKRWVSHSWSVPEQNCLRISVESHMHSERLTPEGEIYKPHFGGLSGHSGTTPFNMAHQKYNLHAFDYYARVILKKDVRLRFINYGDDFICSSSNPDVNYFTFKDFLARTGQRLTPADKGGNEVAFTPLEEVELLKRRFCYHSGHIFGALNADVLYEIPNWILKGIDTEERATQVNCEVALRSCFTHGRDFFEKFRAQLTRAMTAAGVKMNFAFTYDSLLREYMSGVQVFQPAEMQFSSTISPPLEADLSSVILHDRVAATLTSCIAAREAKRLATGASFDRALHQSTSIANHSDKMQVQDRPSLMSGMTDAPAVVSGTTTIESSGILVSSVKENSPLNAELNPYPSASPMTKALERTYLVGTLAWTSAGAALSTLGTIDFPSALLAFNYLATKAKDYQYLKYDAIEIMISYSSNPYLSGTLAFAAMPVGTCAGRQVPEVVMNSGVTLLTASKQETITMRIPAMAYQYLNKIPAILDFEQLRVVILHPLVSLAGGSPALNVSVYARFVNPQLIGPEPRAAYPLAEQQSQVIDEALAKATSGTITGVPEASGGIGKVLDTVGTIAKVVEMAAMSKPLTVSIPELSVPALIPGFGSVTGVDTSQRGSFTIGALVATKGVLPSQTNSMTIADLAKMPGLLAIGTFNSGSVKNDVLFSAPVCPAFTMAGAPGVGQPIYLTNAALIAYSAQQWRGSTKYMVHFDCSPLLSFTVRLSWFPTLTGVSGYDFEGAGGDLIGKIITVTGPTTVTFMVPYLACFGYLDTPTDPNTFSDNNSNGQIVCSVIEPVSSPTGVSVVNWSLWAAMDDDYEIYGINQGPLTLTYNDTPAAEMQMDVRGVFQDKFEGLVPALQFKEMGVNLPESITHIPIGALGKRYFKRDTYTSGTTTLQKDISLDPNDTLFTRLCSIFYYWRGSINVKIIYTKLSTDVSSPVRRVALITNPAFNGDGSLNICNPLFNPVVDLSIPFTSPFLANICVSGDEDTTDVITYMSYMFDLLGSAGRDNVDVYFAVGEDFSVALPLAPLYATYTAAAGKKTPLPLTQVKRK